MEKNPPTASSVEATACRGIPPLAAEVGGLAIGIVFFVLIWLAADGTEIGRTNEFDVWHVLFAIQPFVWGVLFALACKGRQALKGELEKRAQGRAEERTQVLIEDRTKERAERIGQRSGPGRTPFVLAVYGSLLGTIAITRFLLDVPDLPYYLWFVSAAFVVAVLAVWPSIITLHDIQQTALDDEAWSADSDGVRLMRCLRSRTGPATASLGAVIAVAVVVSGSSQAAIAAVAEAEALPSSALIIWGALLTGIVAAVYLHVFAALETRSRWLLDTAAPLVTPDAEQPDAFTKRMSLRSGVSEAIGLGGSARENLESLLVVFSPLVGALLTSVAGLG